MTVWIDLHRWWVGDDLPPEEKAIFKRVKRLHSWLDGFACACPGPMPGEKMCGCMKWIADRRSAAHAIATGEDALQRKAKIMLALADMVRERAKSR